MRDYTSLAKPPTRIIDLNSHRHQREDTRDDEPIGITADNDPLVGQRVIMERLAISRVTLWRLDRAGITSPIYYGSVKRYKLNKTLAAARAILSRRPAR
jgi:hypothetical protein